jgi:hypothetical protein
MEPAPKVPCWGGFPSVQELRVDGTLYITHSPAGSQGANDSLPGSPTDFLLLPATLGAVPAPPSSPAASCVTLGHRPGSAGPSWLLVAVPAWLPPTQD